MPWHAREVLMCHGVLKTRQVEVLADQVDIIRQVEVLENQNGPMVMQVEFLAA